MATILYLMRHGETEWNRDGRFQGQTDVHLSDLGRRQAHSLGARMAAVPLAALYSSDLSRATETARIVAAHRREALPVCLEPRLREVDVGGLAGLTLPEIQARYPEYWAALRQDPVATRAPGGECVLDLLERARAAADAIAGRYPGEAVGIVTHGGLIKALTCHALGLPLNQRDRLQFDNCGITVLRWGTPLRAITINEVGHLAECHAARVEF